MSTTPIPSPDPLALQTALIVARAQAARAQEQAAALREAAEASGATAVILEAELQAARWENEELQQQLAALQRAAARREVELQTSWDAQAQALAELRAELERSRRELAQLQAAGGGGSAQLQRLEKERAALAAQLLERDRWISRQQRELAEKTVRLLQLKKRERERGLAGLLRWFRGRRGADDGAAWAPAGG